MNKFRLYIDEVGNPDLGSSGNPNHRFLSLTGVALDLKHVESKVHPEMEALKRRWFGSHPDDPVILHRKEMVNATGPFAVLKTPDARNKFDADLLGLLKSWEYTAISVCIDKFRHREQYAVWRYEPYHYCMEALLERFVFFLNRSKAHGDVMAESRGGKEDMKLKQAFRQLWEQGTDYVPPEQFQKALTSKELKVKQKAANVAGLQLADMAAHPSREEILHESGLREKKPATFARLVIAILDDKYDRQGNRVYGKKML